MAKTIQYDFRCCLPTHSGPVLIISIHRWPSDCRLVRVALFVCLVLGCSPATRAGLKRCPSLAPLLADTLVAGTGIAGSVWTFNEERYALSAGLAVSSMLVALAANLSECR